MTKERINEEMPQSGTEEPPEDWFLYDVLPYVAWKQHGQRMRQQRKGPFFVAALKPTKEVTQ